MTEGITAVKGITALGKYVGIKSKKKDFVVIYSERLCNAAMMITKNKVKAAHLIVNSKHMEDGKAQAVVINSGIANTCTGEKGLKDAEDTAVAAAQELGVDAGNVLVLSTGLIGAYLPMDKIRDGLKQCKNELAGTPEAAEMAAEAMMTTDTRPKQIVVKVGNITIAGVAKGSGMIHPNMATMLCVILTDAEFGSDVLNGCLKEAVDNSLNMVSVDYDTSTNDSVLILANGLAGSCALDEFQKGLNTVCLELTKMIAADGEGATKLIEVHVSGANDEETAKLVAKSVISSNLVKTAAFGNDPNWGRIIAAMGYSGAEFDALKISVSIQDIPVVQDGIGTEFDEGRVSELMNSSILKISIDLKDGNGEATAYGCDLTHDYVRINAEYHT